VVRLEKTETLSLCLFLNDFETITDTYLGPTLIGPLLLVNSVGLTLHPLQALPYRSPASAIPAKNYLLI